MDGNGTLHSSQTGDLLGGNRWLRILQHASEMFVANLALPFREKKKQRISEFWDRSERKYIPLDDPRLPRSNLFPNGDAVKPRSGATEKKKEKDPGESKS